MPNILLLDSSGDFSEDTFECTCATYRSYDGPDGTLVPYLDGETVHVLGVEGCAFETRS